jgi:hypothetical protein
MAWKAADAVVDRDQVKVAAQAGKHRQRNNKRGKRRQDGGERPPVGGAGEPGQGLRLVVGVGGHQEDGDQCGQAGGDADANQDQPVLLQSPTERESEHQQCCQGRPHQRRPGDEPGAGQRDGGDDDDRGQAATAGNADDAGFGE